MIYISWLVQCLLILLTVAFFTLFERKVIGLFHLRLGPNNVSFLGLLQPLLDAFKLLSKQDLTPFRSNLVSYSFSPVFSLALSLFIWSCLPLISSLYYCNVSILLFFIVGSSLVFFVLLSGWSSNSKYSLIGCLRSVSQSISYEAVLSTLVVLIVIFFFSYSISSFSNGVSNFFLLPIFPIWFVCTLAETHRAPFDFSESESELVSGFNTEYGGAFFAFIFLSEYSVLLFSCVFISYIFFGLTNLFFIVIVSMCLSYLFIWVRVTYCRLRYDILMEFSWNQLLPLSLFLLLNYYLIIIFFSF